MSRVTLSARAEGPADRMAGFIAHLRMNGSAAGAARKPSDALAALSGGRRRDAAAGARGAARPLLLAAGSDSWRKFDDLFDAYWFNAGAQRAGSRPRRCPRAVGAASRGAAFRAMPDGRRSAPPRPGQGDGEAEGMRGRLIATRSDNLRKRDLRELMDEDSLRPRPRRGLSAGPCDPGPAVAAAQAARARAIGWTCGAPSAASLARGGEPIDLFKRARPDRPCGSWRSATSRAR